MCFMGVVSEMVGVAQRGAWGISEPRYDAKEPCPRTHREAELDRLCSGPGTGLANRMRNVLEAQNAS